MKVIVDIEADSLTPTKIWCIVCLDISTNTFHEFYGETLKDFKNFSTQVDKFIAHNGVCYDIPVLNRLLNCNIKLNQVIDTLVLSRLFNVTRTGGHSLRNFGQLFRFPKQEFNDFSKFSLEMLKYCRQDVLLTKKVYDFLLVEGEGFSSDCIQIEHSIQHILQKQKENGFYLDQEKASQLRETCLAIMKEIEFEVEQNFKPKVSLIRTVKPKYKADGSMSTVGLNRFENPLETVGGEFSLIEYVPFNMSSPKQVVERMYEYGWKPVVFNNPSPIMKRKGIKRGSPKVCEENINTLPDSAPKVAKRIGTYLMCANRAKLVEQWFNSLGSDGRVHGDVIGVGANTHRMAHIMPNMANVPSVSFKDDGHPKLGLDGRFGFECRDCFTVQDSINRTLIGVDAKAIQLRILAHYVNNKEFTDAMINGDIHQFNREALGLGSVTNGRAIAKTFIYAFLLGAGDPKLGSIVGGTTKDGAILRAKFMENVTGLKEIKLKNERDAKRGFFIGLDGRKLPIKSAHFALSSYLQGGEAVVMKAAYIEWYNKILKQKLDAKGVAIIHDEFQIDSLISDAEQVSKIVIQAIRNTTKTFKLNCPMDGEAKLGLTWARTH